MHPSEATSPAHTRRHPEAYVRRHLARWFEGRLRPVDELHLTQRNVYILPTRAGLMLGATLLVLLVASINYQLNLGYLLTFLLAGCALVGMHVGHATLSGMTLRLQAPAAHFAGDPARLVVAFESLRQRTRYGIGMAVQGSGHWVWTDVPAQGHATVELAFTPHKRGLQPVPTLTAKTLFPMGTFRVWTLWRPAAQVLVYPAPEPFAPPLPQGEFRAHGAASLRRYTTMEYDGIRAYRRGDPLKLIAWKKAAQSDALISRDASALQQQALWLDLHHTGTPHLELQLSRLCAWILQAEAQGLHYGLRLGTHEIQPGRGAAHKTSCLQALALH